MRRSGWVLAASACVSCLDPAADRAERDEAVGRETRAGFDVRVSGGLAAVRSVTDEQVRLWANAPSLQVRLESERVPRTFELLVDNCMPQATLRTLRGRASLEERSRTRPTACRYRVRLLEAPVELALAEPRADESLPFHFGVLSDIQDGIDRVKDVFERINAQSELAFVLGAGDLTEEGTPSELERFQEEMKALRIPYYVTLGNHEIGTTAPRYHDYFGRGSSSFVFHGARFTLLDSADGTLARRVHEWLDEWLARGRDGVHIVAMHVPPLDPTRLRNGSFISRNEAAAVLGKMAGARVDLTLYGHIHTYQRFTNAGIDAHLSGGGGAALEPFDTTGRHFLDVSVDARGVRYVKVVRVDE